MLFTLVLVFQLVMIFLSLIALFLVTTLFLPLRNSPALLCYTTLHLKANHFLVVVFHVLQIFVLWAAEEFVELHKKRFQSH